ncbi:hypothetical protein TVAG_053450 [Trichomonas vaginalis G3]|uniref:Transmembrane protein n=1 Tax=Trichomonas vaginalis (strain ATCC PRA-98 / G3) TaxID=412133 RepID=A2EMU8_TRIV3|nr:hypothetical protein TVAGG3_0755170 [Trichomonas vaginalis G3]EAY06021.1 hypothetical protein TVAG_053450 [Trichomonas vaginalis G3]KAI5512812.1 hypothetical protein TVAGG3_0755170 [Trichomonas vaginalis G3]|eukprot:XP_001318244.1 hypothetical protein [Trichomonas vaginalis G3]
MVRTVDIDNDDKVLIYSDNNKLIYTMSSYDSFHYNTTSFVLFFRTDSYNTQGFIYAFDTDKFVSNGEHSVLISNTIIYNILPYRYFIVHNPQYFEFTMPQLARVYGEAAFYTLEVSKFEIRPKDSKHTLHFVIVQPPYVNCQNITIYDGYSGNFSIEGSFYHNNCFLMASPYIMDYYLYVSGLQGTANIYCPNGDFVVSLKDEYGFVTRLPTILMHIKIEKTDQKSIICLQQSEIISPLFPNEVFNDKFVTNFTASQQIVQYEKRFYRFSTGFYQYYIPEQGSKFYFNRNSLYIFHNPSSFTIKGNDVSLLENDDYVVNITDFRLTAVVKSKDSTRYLNISVFNYKALDTFSKCNSVDIIDLNSNFKDFVSTSYNDKTFNGNNINFSVEAQQRICLWYVSSNPFTMNIYRHHLENQNDFHIYSEKLGVFNEIEYPSTVTSRSILSIWTTKDEVDGIDEGGAFISVSQDYYDFDEKGGTFRGTRSYMDFPFAKHNSSTGYVLNLGTREEKLNFGQKTSQKKQLTTVQIALIVFAAIIFAVIVVVIIVVAQKHKSDEVNNNIGKGDNEVEMEDIPHQTMYSSSNPTPNNSAAVTTNSPIASATSSIDATHLQTDSSSRPKNPYEPTSTMTATEYNQ